MTPRRLAVVAALLAAHSAVALDLQATLGGGYWRSDLWTPGGYDRQPAWDWLAGGSISGSPFRPGLLSLDGAVDYRSLRSMYFAGSNRTDNLTWRGQVSALSQSVVPISVYGSRASEDFSTDVTTARPGATLVTSEGATAMFRTEAAPVLRFGFSHNDLVSRAFGIPEVTTATTMLSAGAAQSLSTFAYDLAYDTSSSSGSLVETNYRSHNVTAQAQAYPTSNTELRLAERYFLRVPTASSTFSPRIDDNALSLGGTWKGATTRSTLTYAYTHNLTSAPDALEQEVLAHGVGFATDWSLTRELQLTTSANVDFSDARLGADRLRAAGQVVGGAVQWSRKAATGVRPTLTANVSGGVVEPVEGGVQGAFGAGGGGGLAFDWGSTELSASYNVSYATNLSARLGSSLGQNVSLTGQTPFRRLVLRFQLQGAATRRDDPLLGAFLARNVTANVDGRFSWMRAGLTAGLTSGLDPSVSAGPSDGLFIPARYNANTYLLGGHVAADVVRGLTAELVGRWLQVELPGRAPEHERSVGLQVGYRLGQFLFTVEERYAVSGLAGADQTGNSFVVRATRAFGAKL